MKKILITGAPGAGKTTLLQGVARALNPRRVTGFFTREVRVDGVRRGFEAVAFGEGPRHLLAHIDIDGPFKVGRYGVDVQGFEAFVEALVIPTGDGVVLIDEIGKMECLSGKFRAMVRDLLNSDRDVVATVAEDGRGLIADVKLRRHAILYHIDAANRDAMLQKILAGFTGDDR